jgi:hypothetical protein
MNLLLHSLNPGQLPWCSSPRHHLLDTWSRHSLMINFLRRRGCEPLRFAPRRLGFVIFSGCRGPGGRLTVGLACRSHHLQNPGLGHLPHARLAWV